MLYTTAYVPPAPTHVNVSRVRPCLNDNAFSRTDISSEPYWELDCALLTLINNDTCNCLAPLLPLLLLLLLDVESYRSQCGAVIFTGAPYAWHCTTWIALGVARQAVVESAAATGALPEASLLPKLLLTKITSKSTSPTW